MPSRPSVALAKEAIEVQFGFNARTVFDVDPVDLFARGAGLMRDQGAAQHFLGFFGFLIFLGLLSSTCIRAKALLTFRIVSELFVDEAFLDDLLDRLLEASDLFEDALYLLAHLFVEVIFLRQQLF